MGRRQRKPSLQDIQSLPSILLLLLGSTTPKNAEKPSASEIVPHKHLIFLSLAFTFLILPFSPLYMHKLMHIQIPLFTFENPLYMQNAYTLNSLIYKAGPSHLSIRFEKLSNPSLVSSFVWTLAHIQALLYKSRTPNTLSTRLEHLLESNLYHI